MRIRPITFKEASAFVSQHHRHHGATVGCKFCLGCYDGDKLIGVAVCGRPVSRCLDNGMVCEVTRLCTDGTRNACSMLYGACARVAKAMGYAKIVTYILETESGVSLRASGWILEGDVKGDRTWGCKSRPRQTKSPTCRKQRWSKQLNEVKTG